MDIGEHPSSLKLRRAGCFAAPCVMNSDSEVTSLNSGRKTTETQRNTEVTEDLNNGKWDIKERVTESSL